MKTIQELEEGMEKKFLWFSKEVIECILVNYLLESPNISTPIWAKIPDELFYLFVPFAALLKIQVFSAKERFEKAEFGHFCLNGRDIKYRRPLATIDVACLPCTDGEKRAL